MKPEKTTRADDQPGAPQGGRLGLAVRPPTAEERKELGGAPPGLVVEAASGPAAKAGLRRGDLITAGNGQTGKSVQEFRALVEKSKDPVAGLARRGAAPAFGPIQVRSNSRSRP